VPDGLVVLGANEVLGNTTYQVVAQFPIHQLGVTSFGEAKLLADSSGNMWFTTPKKLFRFDISSMRFQIVKPRLVLEDIKINLKETEWTEFPHTLKDLYQLPDSLVLSYRQSSIGFYFKAALQNNSGEFRYSYHLRGLDTTWSPSSVGNYISFVNLPAGKYRFAVRARNSVSEWSEPVFFHFTILPPFWERWWFRTAFILAIAFFIIYIFRSRIKKIQEEASVQNQLRELELKALKAQMNPHFIYNALNSIQALVSGDKKEESIKYIGSFSRLLRQVLEYSDKNVITLEKELETLRLYIQLESLRLDMKLNYREAISDQVVTEYEKLPPLLLQPFIENALWHGLSRKEGEKQLELAIEIESDWLICKITDNGVGLQNAAEWNSKNLRIGQSMATSINYKRLSQFNRTENPLPLEYKELTNEANIVIGTSVVLHIKRIISP
jgi:two-component sensor histidine kinase